MQAIERIEGEFKAFVRRVGFAPNALVIHPEFAHKLTEELFALRRLPMKGVIDYHGALLIHTTEVPEFRLGLLFPLEP